GEYKKLTEAELFANMYQPDKDLRYRALQTIVNKYKENQLVFTHIFTNILKDWDLGSKKKNYKKPISRRNLSNELSDEVVDVLGKVSTKNYQIVEKYYNLKKKLLGLTELHMSDIYAPVGEITKNYSYAEAIELIKTISYPIITLIKIRFQKYLLEKNVLTKQKKRNKKNII
ncbi:unnamed protein product, partial [marine sediment metagenome]